MSRTEYHTPSKHLEPDKIKRLASLGLGLAEIAGALGFSSRTLARRREEDPQIDEWIAEGRSQGVADVANALKQRALDGDTACMKIFLQALGENYGRRSNLHVTGNNQPQIQILLTSPDGSVLKQ